MKPKKKDWQSLIVMGIAVYLVMIVLSLHVGMAAENGGDLFSVVLAGINSFSKNPFSIRFTSFSLKYILMFTGVFAFAALWISVDNERNRALHQKDSDGSAEWNTNLTKFKKQFTDQDLSNNIILTNDISLSMNSRKTMRNNNVLVVGGSGSGKTRYVIKPNLLQANCSFVVTDPKGEILAAEGEMLKKHGYKIKVFNLTDMKHSHSYNPFEYIRDDLGVLMMINCLIKNTNNGQKGGDPFWEKSETALLQALVFYLVKNPNIPKECKNFTNVMKLLQAAEVNENDPNAQSPLDKLFGQLETIDPNSIAVKQYKTFKMGAGKTLKSILISCAVRLTVFNLQEIENLTMKDNLDLGKIGDEKTALFVVIPAADDTYNFLVSMMYSQLFETLYYHAENECPYQYYIKEGKDVLAITNKSPRGDSYTEKEAKKLLMGLKRAPIKQIRSKKQFVIKAKDFQKEFYTREAALEYKTRLEKATIEKGAIRLPYPVRFLLDEFANIGQIPDFTKKLATMRQYEISCTIILQNLAQIKTMYKDDWESIVGNCDSFLFLGGQEFSTLEYISKELGAATIQVKGRGMSQSAKGGNASKNFSNKKRNLMDPNEISVMPKDECILIINGMHPFYGKKFKLETHPNYKESGDSDSANRFDCKKEILNYGLLQQMKSQQQGEVGAEPGIDKFIGETKSLDQVFKEEKIMSVNDAVNRIVLKKGKVVLNEKKDKDTGEIDFDYNVE